MADQPTTPQAEKLNLILIQLDSLNRHFLACYGNDWVKAPNLAAFAGRAAIFDRHFVGALPCMPARREIWAGTQEFWWRNWGPLEPWDRPLAYLAGRAGIITQLVTDHYHFFEWGSHNYNYDFAGYEFIRGHEYDNWRTDPLRGVPDWAERMIRERGEEVRIYLRNVQDFRDEADFFGPKVMAATADWLDRNHDGPQFYLHVDSFDVHEPFHIPEPYRSLYTDRDHRLGNPWPRYGRIDDPQYPLSQEDVDWIRAQFAGKLTMVDTWLGRVFDVLDRRHLWDRTAVIITTDHGHYLGDHGWMGKPAAPLYSTLCHIPLLVWLPGGAHNGRRVDAMTQTLDLYATALDLLGCPIPTEADIHSRSFAPVLRGTASAHRDSAVYGYNNQTVAITSGDWTLMRDHDPKAGPQFWYTHQIDQLRSRSFQRRLERTFDYPGIEPGHRLPGVAPQVWRMPGNLHLPPTFPRPDLLFNNADDPGQTVDLANQRPDVLRQLENQLREYMQRLAVPEEQYARLRL